MRGLNVVYVSLPGVSFVLGFKCVQSGSSVPVSCQCRLGQMSRLAVLPKWFVAQEAICSPLKRLSVMVFYG